MEKRPCGTISKPTVRSAIDFYRTANLGVPAAAVERYLGTEFIQHNPGAGDGPQAFIACFDEMARDYPGKQIEFVRALAGRRRVRDHGFLSLRR